MLKKMKDEDRFTDPALNKVKQLISKEHVFEISGHVNASLLEAHHDFRRVHMPKFSSYYEWLVSNVERAAKDNKQKKSHPSKAQMQLQNAKFFGVEDGPKQSIRAFRLYAINMLNQHVRPLECQSTAHQHDYEFTHCDVKEHLAAVKRLRAHALKNQETPRSGFKHHRVLDLALKKNEEKEEMLTEPWEELMKNKEERQFQIGRITKYFSS